MPFWLRRPGVNKLGVCVCVCVFIAVAIGLGELLLCIITEDPPTIIWNRLYGLPVEAGPTSCIRMTGKVRTRHGHLHRLGRHIKCIKETSIVDQELFPIFTSFGPLALRPAPPLIIKPGGDLAPMFDRVFYPVPRLLPSPNPTVFYLRCNSRQQG